MPAQPFFRDVQMPSHRQDHLAHQRFLLDTYAERRAQEKRRAAPSALLARLLALVGRGARN